MDKTSGMTTASEPDFSSINQEVFWALHGKKIVIASIAALLVLIAFGTYLGWQALQATQAEAAYDSAANIEGWEKVVERFPGSIAAGNALLRIAAQQSSEGRYPDSDKTYQRFVQDYPKHPFAVNGLMGLATNAEAETKPDEAIKYYAEIASKLATTYLAPMALLSQARLTEGKGQLKEARQFYELVVQRYPQSVIAQIASAEASRLNDKLGKEQKQSAPTNLLTSSPQPTPSGKPSPTVTEKPKQKPEP
ncbi:MAG TPA: tetratricopeptide repeat protein [Chthoniobacterales bacterium]|nr:tetratricopeptide repeat protein [Chthoniobacterales bacterium]